MKKQYLFSWQGVNREKITLNGEISAANAAAATAHLRQNGIRVRKLSRRWFIMPWLTNQTIKSSEIIAFSRQLATLVGASIPLVQALTIIMQSSLSKAFKNLLLMLSDEVQTGIKLCVAVSKYPRYFSNFFCSLVRIGEETGSLDKILENIATTLEKSQALKGKITKALFYPGLILLVSLSVAGILLVVVVPKFESLFANFNATLPAFTLFFINLSKLATHYIFAIFLGLLALIIIGMLAKHYSTRFNKLLARLVLKLPIIGPLIRKIIVARFSAMLATTFTAGMPLVEALKIVAKTTGNVIYESELLRVGDAISNGHSLHSAIEATHLFPPLLTQMISIGEETGKLDKMLNKIATIYIEEIDATVAVFSTLIEPLVMIIVGVLVGSLVFAMYLPIFKLGSII